MKAAPTIKSAHLTTVAFAKIRRPLSFEEESIARESVEDLSRPIFAYCDDSLSDCTVGCLFLMQGSRVRTIKTSFAKAQALATVRD